MPEFNKLNDYIWRWENHYKMLSELEKTNIDKEKITEWKELIDQHFLRKIKAKL